jgi:SAM-dependent methyltransferase
MSASSRTSSVITSLIAAQTRDFPRQPVRVGAGARFPKVEGLRELLAENRRLSREATELRERLLAIERSRWWRLNPRAAFHRLGPAEPPAADEPPTTAPPTTSPLEARGATYRAFHEEVVDRGTFTEDWFTDEISWLEPLLEPLAGTSSRILEIGSFEGLSTCFFLWRLRDGYVTAIDTFEGIAEHAGYGSDVSDLAARFDENVALVDAARVRKLEGDSRHVLVDLLGAGDRFDLAYVDGSHLALDVLVDASLAWQLLEDGGILVFDDYTWHGFGDERLLRPGPAIDAFLALVTGKHEELHRGEQLALRRTA